MDNGTPAIDKKVCLGCTQVFVRALNLFQGERYPRMTLADLLMGVLGYDEKKKIQ